MWPHALGENCLCTADKRGIFRFIRARERYFIIFNYDMELTLIKKIQTIAVAGAAMLAMGMPASASTFDSEVLDTFVETATACIVGDVTSTEFVTKAGLVFTQATVAVTDTAFGSTASEVKILIPGGRVANTKFPIRQSVAGAPSISVGQKMMLVLNATPESNSYAIAGLANGAINIVDNGSGPQVALGGNAGLITLSEAISEIQEIRAGDSALGSQ